MDSSMEPYNNMMILEYRIYLVAFFHGCDPTGWTGTLEQIWHRDNLSYPSFLSQGLVWCLALDKPLINISE